MQTINCPSSIFNPKIYIFIYSVIFFKLMVMIKVLILERLRAISTPIVDASDNDNEYSSILPLKPRKLM